MIDELNRSINEYQKQWQTFVAERADPAFFAAQLPTGIGWKLSDTAALMQTFQALRDHCDQIHWGWIQNRWLVTMHLRDRKLAWDIAIIKLLQRKPDSPGSSGFDHIDFYHPHNQNLEAKLQAENNLTWTHKANSPHCTYYSINFAGYEAKLRTNTVLTTCIAALQTVNDKQAVAITSPANY